MFHKEEYPLLIDLSKKAEELGIHMTLGHEDTSNQTDQNHDIGSFEIDPKQLENDDASIDFCQFSIDGLESKELYSLSSIYFALHTFAYNSFATRNEASSRAYKDLLQYTTDKMFRNQFEKDVVCNHIQKDEEER